MYYRKKILLVEDEPINARVSKRTLEKYGYEVIHSKTGEKAVEIVNSSPGIDLILMDIDLGDGIDGTETAEIILKEHDIPLVFLSSHTEPEIVNKTEKITSYGYIVKNTGETVLIASMKMAFRLFEARKNEEEKERWLSEKNEELAAMNREFEAANEQLIRTIAQLDQSENEYRLLFETSSSGIFIISGGRLGIFNHAMIEVTGWSSEQLLERPLLSFVHPEDAGRAADHYRRVIKERKTEISSPVRIIAPGNRIKWLGIKSCYIPWEGEHSALNYISDITERKEAEDALKVAEERYRSLFMNSGVGIFLTDFGTGVVLEANDCFARLFGFKDRDDLIAVPPSVYSFYDEPGVYEEISGILKSEGRFDSYESRFRRVDGSAVWLQLSARLVPDKGWVEGVLVDITDRKKSEERVNSLLLEKDISLKETHHRIKNNMNVISGLLYLQAGEQKEPLSGAVLKDAADRIHSMMALYDKLHCSEERREMQADLYLVPLINELVGTHAGLVPVETEIQIGDFDLSAKLLTTLGIIINELISNSMKHAFEGSGGGVLTLSLSENKNEMTFIYRDDGVGFPEQAASGDLKGFGMQLIHMLVEQIRGTVSVIRENGTGFEIRFPV